MGFFKSTLLIYQFVMKTIQLIILCAFFIGNAFAQQPVQTKKTPNTIKGQFDQVYKKSNSYEVFKVIRKDRFLKLQKNVLDSISVLKKDALTKQQSINSLKENITSLESEISTLNSDLSKSLTKENNISLFGLQLNKVTYNTILWGIIASLLTGLLFFIFRYNKSNSLTKDAKNNLQSVEQEFEQHRKKAIEKEQKLRRQLQDEINKQRGS